MTVFLSAMPTSCHYRHGTGVEEEGEEGQERDTTGKQRSSSPTSAEIDLLVQNVFMHGCPFWYSAYCEIHEQTVCTLCI